MLLQGKGGIRVVMNIKKEGTNEKAGIYYYFRSNDVFSHGSDSGSRFGGEPVFRRDEGKSRRFRLQSHQFFEE